MGSWSGEGEMMHVSSESAMCSQNDAAELCQLHLTNQTAAWLLLLLCFKNKLWDKSLLEYPSKGCSPFHQSHKQKCLPLSWLGLPQPAEENTQKDPWEGNPKLLGIAWLFDH